LDKAFVRYLKKKGRAFLPQWISAMYAKHIEAKLQLIYNVLI